MSAFVDDISLLVDFPSPTAAITPAAGPPGTTFLLTGKYNTPYGWVDICFSPCSPDNYITTVYADAAGDIAAFLDASADIAPGPYLIQTSDLADRTAETQLTITGAADPSLSVDPTSGPAGTTFQFSGSDFIPNDTTIAVTLNGAAFGTVGSDSTGAVSFKLNTSANTPAGTLHGGGHRQRRAQRRDILHRHRRSQPAAPRSRWRRPPARPARCLPLWAAASRRIPPPTSRSTARRWAR